jgi:hypothetical protein
MGRCGRQHAQGRGLGLVAFASVVLAVVGIFNLIYGIAAVANAHVFVAGAHYVWGDLTLWGTGREAGPPSLLSPVRLNSRVIFELGKEAQLCLSTSGSTCTASVPRWR